MSANSEIHKADYSIVIIDCTEQEYNGEIITLKPTGGIPLVVTHLAEELARAGCNVTVENKTPENKIYKNVTWENRNNPQVKSADFVIACNDVKIFDQSPYRQMIEQGAIPILWLHNLFTWKRAWKKKRIGSLFRRKPDVVFLSEYHAKNCAKFMPLGMRSIIPHGVGHDFFDIPQSSEKRIPQALFLSKAFRGFSEVMALWVKSVHPSCPQAILKAYIGKQEIGNYPYTEEQLKSYGIEIMDRAPQPVLMKEMQQSSCLIYPGHKDETFCNVAAECSVMGLPVITKGIGALTERVASGGGVLAHSDADIAQAVIRCMTDSKYTKLLSDTAFASRDEYRWERRINEWLGLFAELRRG
ncbi:MAG: glycosyltransferase [Pseudobdellovibrionaceae bacterium]|jgi:glycosyltransferase involved in cell wall biosynthesis|nr:glycosyltransferase [Pseudobdellovibrionaceae bacterium]